MTSVRVSVGDDQLTAILDDNPTAADLVGQLPLTLSFTDLHAVEKIAPLPRPLSTEGAPPGASPVRGDIGYYAPLGNIVL